MPYITVPQSPMYHQITLEEILSGTAKDAIIRTNETNTRTFFTEKDGSELYNSDTVNALLITLGAFNARHAELRKKDRHSLYREFFIPKKTGGLRKICAPEPELYDALVELRTILTTQFNASYHTSAFAYVKDRCTVDAVKRHQQNNSHWFLKVDFHDFFGSTTKDYTIATLRNIVPFNLLCGVLGGQEILEEALDLCFLDGGLPQGTPISPMLTNLLMIPVDHKLSKALRDFNGQQFIYTRYADDMLISALQDFKPSDIQQLIRDVLKDCGAPYTFKEEKTRYGSRAGSNWNLGVMLNKDNEITVGHKNKKYFRAMLTSYILDSKHNKPWNKEDVQHLAGLLSYYKMIEEDYFSDLIEKINAKYETNIHNLIVSDLRY